MGALILYDISNQESFDRLEYWIKDIKENSISDDCVIYIIGNKCDNEKNRVIPKEQGEEFAKENNFKFYEISALNKSSNINELLNNINQDILKNKKEENKNLGSVVLNQEENRSWCCW